jgi:hypothetical protein
MARLSRSRKSGLISTAKLGGCVCISSVPHFKKDRPLAASARRICSMALGPMPCN